MSLHFGKANLKTTLMNDWTRENWRPLSPIFTSQVLYLIEGSKSKRFATMHCIIISSGYRGEDMLKIDFAASTFVRDLIHYFIKWTSNDR
jgi:hypothetical protein